MELYYIYSPTARVRVVEGDLLVYVEYESMTVLDSYYTGSSMNIQGLLSAHVRLVTLYRRTGPESQRTPSMRRSPYQLQGGVRYLSPAA